jgi:hypothetical protein
MLLGFAVMTPASAASPSWVSNGQFANYSGGINLPLGTPGQAGYIKFQFTLTANWALSNTSGGQTTVTGGWNATIDVFFNGTTMFSGSFSGNGTESVSTASSIITADGGFGFFGMEQMGQHTVLWVDNTTGLTVSNVTIGGRQTAAITSSLPISFLNASLPITRFYDTQTGLLMAFDISLNTTGGGLLAPAPRGAADVIGLLSTCGAVKVDQGLGTTSLGSLTIPVALSNTNIISYAWSPGGGLTQWVTATGAIIALSVLFGVVIYSKKKR